MKIDDYTFFDLKKQKNKPEIYLATPQRKIITKLYDAFNIRCVIKLARINELDFDIPYDIETLNNPYDILDGVTLTKNNVIDKLKNRFLIKFKLGDYIEWYIIREQEDIGDEQKDYRSIRCFSLGYELKNIKIIQYNVISYTLLEILKGKPFDTMPGILSDSLWSVGHIDQSILKKYRAYDCVVKNGLDNVFELSEIFSCVPIFDTENRLINFYDMDNIGENRGLKINRKKYLKTLATKSVGDEIVTRLKVYGRDSLSIRRINPLGTDYIEDYSYFMFPYGMIDNEGNEILISDYLSIELCEAIKNHKEKINNYSPTFTSLISKLEILTQLLIAKSTELRNLQNELIQFRDNLKIAEKGRSGGTTVQFFQGKIDEKQIQIEIQEIQVRHLNDERLSIDSQINDIKQELSEKKNYTAELLEEKRLFTIEDDFINSSIIEEYELYKAAIEYFDEVNKPKISISIDIIDFLGVLEEQHNWEKLKLGDIIRIKYEKFKLEESVRIVELGYDFEAETVNLVITNVKDFVFTDEVDSLARLLHRNINMVKIVDVSKLRWDGISGVKQTLEDILANPWETLGLQDDINWEMDDRVDRLYDEIQELLLPEIELTDFAAWLSNLRFELEALMDFKLKELKWPDLFPEIEEPGGPGGPCTPCTIDQFIEYPANPPNWNQNGVTYTYQQQYSVEPQVTASVQCHSPLNDALMTHSFKCVPVHIIQGGVYVGVTIVPQGTSIPTIFNGHFVIRALCREPVV